DGAVAGHLREGEELHERQRLAAVEVAAQLVDHRPQADRLDQVPQQDHGDHRGDADRDRGEEGQLHHRERVEPGQGEAHAARAAALRLGRARDGGALLRAAAGAAGRGALAGADRLLGGVRRGRRLRRRLLREGRELGRGLCRAVGPGGGPRVTRAHGSLLVRVGVVARRLVGLVRAYNIVLCAHTLGRVPCGVLPTILAPGLRRRTGLPVYYLGRLVLVHFDLVLLAGGDQQDAVSLVGLGEDDSHGGAALGRHLGDLGAHHAA